MDKLDQRFKKSAGFWKSSISTAFGVGLERAVSAGIRGVFGALNAGIASLQEQGKVVAQTNAAIKSTGGEANVTADEIRKLSEATESKTAIDDKLIQTDANLLLTFTNIRNEQGKGNDVFTQAVGIFEDMKTAMPSASVVQLGKALNDPIKGLTALTKVGVTFTEEQKATIKGLVSQGDALKDLKEAGVDVTKEQKALIKSFGPAVDTLAAADAAHVKLSADQIKTFEGMRDGTGIIQAQKIILGELNKEFGGSGAAFAATDAGKAAKFADAVEDIQKAFAVGLLPAITRVRESLTAFLSNPETMGQVEQFGNAIASIFSEGNIRTAASLMTTAAGAISTAIKLFSGLPKEVQALAVGALVLKKFTGIGVTDIAKTIGGELFKRGGTPANPLFVSDVAGGLGGAAGAGGKFGTLASLVGKVLLVGIAAEIASAIHQPLDDLAKNIHDSLIGDKNPLSDFGRSWEDWRKNADWPFGQKNAPDWARFGDKPSDPVTAGLVGNLGRNGPMPRTLVSIEAATIAMNSQLHADLQAAIKSLDSGPLADALAGIIKAVTGGAGSGKTTGDIVTDLKTRRDAALKAGDKATANALSDAIKKIEPFAKGRQWQKEQIDAAKAIATSNKSTADKVAALKGIEQDLLSHQRSMAAGIVGGLLDVVTAIQNIKLPAGSSPNVNDSTGFVVPGGVPLPKPSPSGTPKVNPNTGFVVNANVNVSTRDVKAAQLIRDRIGPTPASAGSI